MKYLIPLFVLSSFLVAEIEMPKQQKFYISGVEFDTKIYCADFSRVIELQAQKIKALEEEIRQLRQLQQQQLSEKLKKEHQTELKKEAEEKPASPNMIIISDKPIH